MKQLVTADEVAAYLQVGRSTVYRWAEVGMIPAFRLGPGILRFDPEAFKDWLRGRTNPSRKGSTRDRHEVRGKGGNS